LEEQLAVPCLLQCSVARKLPASAGTLDYWRFARITGVSWIDSHRAGWPRIQTAEATTPAGAPSFAHFAEGRVWRRHTQRV